LLRVASTAFLRALANTVCPYYFTQELARWSDVIVSSFNHYFELSAMFHGLMQQSQWRVGVPMEDAHNLIERRRMTYMAELDQSSPYAMRHQGPLPRSLLGGLRCPCYGRRVASLAKWRHGEPSLGSCCHIAAAV
jgi:hypothetical protein